MDEQSRPSGAVWAGFISLVAGSLLLGSRWRWIPAAALAAIAVAAWRRRDEPATWLAAVGLVVVGMVSGLVSTVWVAAAVAGAVLLARPDLRSRQMWLRFGAPNRAVIALMVVTVIAAAIALVVWANARPPLSNLGETSPLDQVIDQARRTPWWLFPIAAAAFALLNALAEEFVYRGIVLQALLPAGVGAAVVLGGFVFGAIHLSGVPSGWWGVAMASVYGAALGWLRIRSNGLAAPILVHVAADFVIAYLARYSLL